MVEPNHPNIPVTHQCALLQVSRSQVYRRLTNPVDLENSVSQEDLAFMVEIDKIYTKWPFYGVRRMTWQLNHQGFLINHKRVARLMKTMGIQAVFPRPNTSKPSQQHEKYPYLLKGLNITQPNQVWGVDITYIKMHKSWVYLMAIMDWYSRYVIAWELSPSMEVGFCTQALSQALSHNQPQIHNSDQGSQFTCNEYLTILKACPNIQISMDGRGRCMDNIFTERLWRSLKYEEVYLKDYQNFSETKQAIGNYFQFYNQERPHQSLNYQTPSQIYFQ